MAVAEILAGIALVKKSAEIISKGINAAQDMGALATQVDDLFEGKRQLKQEERQQRAVGKSPTQTVIDQRLADEHIAEVKSLIIGRFGFYAWTEIITLQREQQHEEKNRQALAERAKAENKEQMAEIAVTSISLIIGITVVAMVAIVMWAMN